MNRFTKPLLTAALFFTASVTMAASVGANIMFSARLNGAQEVPAVTTTASGVAGFTLNAAQDSLWLNVNVTGLSGIITGIHIHEAAAGTNGAVVIDLMASLTGTTINAVLTGSSVTKAALAKMIQGLYYINVHTAANPGGEIRGQIQLESDLAFVANLDGAQQTPPVTTTAKGLGVFNLAKHEGVLKFNVVVDGLSGAITSAHLHSGAVGTSGGVVLDLGAFISGNTISGQADPALFLIALKSGNIYVNVHTAANPNGEIRGQLVLTNGINFDAMLTGAQQTPPVTTTAKGVASFKLNATMDSLWCNVVTNGLSGAINSAHFHNGAVGVSGGVAVDLTSSISGNTLFGVVTGSALTQAFINAMLTGNVYINLHTTANPNGEIRGQVWRVLREGYNIVMDGLQQKPVVITTARGAGIVSIDRDETNVHYMIVATNITMTSAHFHSGLKGESGPVVYDLSTAFTNNGAFGYWKSTDATAFTSVHARQFLGDSIYVNIHTAANANGEIRGQAVRQYMAQSATGIKNAARNTAFELYPNPAHNMIFVGTDQNIRISDMMGKTILEQAAGGNIDISGLQPGMYFIHVNGKTLNGTKAFVKQ